MVHAEFPEFGLCGHFFLSRFSLASRRTEKAKEETLVCYLRVVVCFYFYLVVDLWLFILLQMKRAIDICMYIFLGIFTLEMIIKVQF